MFDTMYDLTTTKENGRVVHTITDRAGRVVDRRAAACAYRGAVLAVSEMHHGASVWSWHLTTDGARNAAASLRRSRPEIVFAAVTEA